MGCIVSGDITICTMDDWLGPPDPVWLTPREFEILELIEELGGKVPRSGVSGPLGRRLTSSFLSQKPWKYPLLVEFGPYWALSQRGREVLEMQRAGVARYDQERKVWVAGEP